MKRKSNIVRWLILVVSAFQLFSFSAFRVWAYPPAPATQAQVNAGTEPYLYVTPNTLANKTGGGSLSSKQLNTLATAITSYTDQPQEGLKSYLSPLSSPEWQFVGRSAIPSYRNNEWFLSENGLENGDPTTSGYYWYNIPVTMGATGITATVYMHSIYGTNVTVKLELWNQNTSLMPYATTNTVTPTPQAFTVTGATNGNYLLNIHTAGNGVAVSNNIALTFAPAPTDPVLSAPFVRYRVTPQQVFGDAGSYGYYGQHEVYQGQYADQSVTRASPSSYVEFKTTATNIALEIFAQAAAQYATISVNGVVVTNITSQASGTPIFRNIYPYNINSSQNMNTIRVVGYRGNQDGLSAVYVPTGSSVEFKSHEPQRKLLIIGDSIMTSLNTTNRFNTIARMLEQVLPLRVFNYSSFGISLYDMWQTSPNKLWLSDAISESDPSDVWIEQSFNDWAHANWASTNTFISCYGNIVDTIHSYLPRATIYCQSAIPVGPTYSGTNANGETLAQYRTAVQYVTLSRTNYCIFVDGTSVIQARDISADDVHPTDSGNVHIASWMKDQIWTNRIVVLPQFASNSIVSLIQSNTYSATFTGSNNLSTFASTNGNQVTINYSLQTWLLTNGVTVQGGWYGTNHTADFILGGNKAQIILPW